MNLTDEEIMARAVTIEIPDGATHIAVSRVHAGVQPAYWHEESLHYLEENPALLKKGDWATAFKRPYWEMVPIAKVRATHPQPEQQGGGE